MDNKCCCFFGHRKIEDTEELRRIIYNNAERLILEENVSIFLFGSKSQFNGLCHKIISNLKDKYSHIKRVYVRAEYPYINDDYKNYLLQSYEDTYYPERAMNAGKAVYLKRNFEMIDKSDFCIVYYDPIYRLPQCKNSKRDLTEYQPNSGTKTAYDYAKKKCKTIINVKVCV